ncbi:hypothetical protein EJ074_01845 [Mesorhizobium sp. M3A.F.Ca.ET.080.04.2.1]|nr:hypothetical protein EJ074_01845 [Mesorhizobium sp. M3A.F.Ca.ET.080.04.2.1]
MFCVTAMYHVNAFWAFAGSVVNGTPTRSRRGSLLRSSGSAPAKSRQRSLTMWVRSLPFFFAPRRAHVRQPAEGVPWRRCAHRGSGAVRKALPLQSSRRLRANRMLPAHLPDRTRPKARLCRRTSIYFDARVVDEHDRDVSPGTPGQLLLRSRTPHGLFRRYWRDPEQTKAAFKGKWFATRDPGHGRIFFHRTPRACR